MQPCNHCKIQVENGLKTTRICTLKRHIETDTRKHIQTIFESHKPNYQQHAKNHEQLKQAKTSSKSYKKEENSQLQSTTKN